ncbi:MAG: hypothetical protein R3B40_31595 [Polyangiales bacterium]
MSTGDEQVRWLVVAPTSGLSGLLPAGSHVNGILGDNPLTLDLPGFSAPISNLRNLTSKWLLTNSTELQEAAKAAEALSDSLDEAGLHGLRSVPELSAMVDAAQGGDAAERVFSAADLPTATSAASSAVTAFVSAVRGGQSSSQRRRAAREVRDTVEAYCHRLASERLLAAQQVESNLRGLDLLLRACPSASQIAVDLIDADAASALGIVRERLSAADALPDAVFIMGTPADLAELADLAESLAVPVLFEASADLAVKDERTGELVASADWEAVRATDASRWLCAVSNTVVLFSEGAGESTRTVEGSPVWALGALLSQSFAKTGGFANVLGRPGALKAPGVKRVADMSLPTGAFVSIRDQAQLADCGILALGSGRNDDQVTLSVAPTACAAKDKLPLAGQILTGRVVRFAWWVHDQVPAGADDATVKALFEDASRVFLFPGMQEMARLLATPTTTEDGRRVVQVTAAAAAALAGCTFELDFELPL